MDYEKKYKEALERAKKFKENPKAIFFGEKNVHVSDYIFPELQESEDERIRKALIDLIYKIYANTSYITCDEHERMLAWLEKQGEKLPVGFYYVNSEGKKFYSDTFKYGNVTLHVEKQGEKDSQVTLPPFTFDDILALQRCMETVKKVQEDKDLYEKLNDLHGRVYDAYQLEKQGQVKESAISQHEDTHEDVSCKENSNSLTDVDERIRKELTDYIKKKFENSFSLTPSKNILANWISWLEKQGGQKVVGWTAEDEEELEIALNTLEKAGQYSSAKWLRNVCLVPKTIQKPNPYSGTSFDYNGHTWGMCARDNGVEILFDGELKAFLSLEKSFIYPIHPQPELPKTK